MPSCAPQGLTYAEYARSGFFQLVGAAALMLVVIGVGTGARTSEPGTDPALARRDRVHARRSFVVAAQRMRLYEDAYGLTVLRLVVLWSILWIAISLVLVAIAIARVRASQRWLTGAVALAAAGVLIALNVSNPEAMIARTNLDRARHGAQIDRVYLAGLSADAAGVLARDPLGRDLVGRHRHDSSILAWNLARSR